MLFFPPSNIVPSPPTRYVQMAEFNLLGDKGQTYNNKVTQLNDEQHIFIEIILCVRPHVKYFACFISFKSQKRGNVISQKPSEVI